MFTLANVNMVQLVYTHVRLFALSPEHFPLRHFLLEIKPFGWCPYRLLKIVVSIKNLLGNEQWGAVDSIKHCKKQLPLK